MLKEEVVEFLGQIMPFNFLSEEELADIVKEISMEYYPQGIMILTQGGPPSKHLHIIKKGGIKVFITSEDNEETIIDYRGENEMFGLLSVVGGDRSRTNIFTVEDTICYLIPKDNILSILQKNSQANEYFLKSFFFNFIDKTYEKTREKYSSMTHGDQLLYTTPVGQVIHRSPVTASQDLTIQQAAQKMATNRISSLIVLDNNEKPVGMLTDRDLREKVVAVGKNVENSIQSIMNPSLVTIHAHEYCFEALLKMIHNKIHHIIVMNDNQLQGIVTNHDFMALQGASPTALVKEIGAFQSVQDIRESLTKLYKTITVLLQNGAKAHDITGFITEMSEKIANSIVDLTEKLLGQSPLPYTLFIFGDGGRRELSLDFNIRLGIIWRDTDDLALQKENNDYSSKFIQKINEFCLDGLACKKPCIEAGNAKTLNSWKNFFLEKVSESTAGPRANFFEVRGIRGKEKVVNELRDLLWSAVTNNNEFIELIATATVSNRPPLGFFKDFVMEKSGEHKNELNIYEKGIKPLVDAVRIFVLGKNIRQLTTRRRLAELKNINFEKVDDIEQAIDYLRILLLHKQLQQVESGIPPDNYLRPESLDTYEKKILKESFQLISSLYEIIATNHRTGW